MEKLKDYTLEIIVMDKDRIGRNECIGKVTKCETGRLVAHDSTSGYSGA